MLRTLPPSLPGLGLGAYRGVAAVDLENLGAPIEGRPDGVDMTFWALRRGDSGRGSEGRDLALKAGLATRPGAIDLLNLAGSGVGGV